MHSLIVAPDGGNGELAKIVDLAVRGVICTNRATLGGKRGPALFDRRHQAPLKKAPLTDAFKSMAWQQAVRVLGLWGSTGKDYGDDLVENYALNLQGSSAPKLDEICKSVAEDAYNYLVLVAEWGDYVQAIRRLRFGTALWLYRRPYP